MGTRRLRTADYSQDARERLGEAIARQREADGYKFRPAFAKIAKVSLRSLAAVENAEPGVGGANLRAIGRALSTWNEDTPRVILEGGPIPPTNPEEMTPEEPDLLDPQDEYERMIVESSLSKKEKRQLVRGYRDALEEERRVLRPDLRNHPNIAARSNDTNTHIDG